MTVLKGLKAALGAGELKVDVACDDELHVGGAVHGTATITGGEVPQIVQGLDLSLQYRWPVSNEGGEQADEGARPVQKRSIPCQLDVSPGSVHKVPFTFDLPLDTPLAEPGDWHSVDVNADIPGAVDVRGSRRVTLLPPKEIVAAIAAIAATGWVLDGYEPRKAKEGFIRAVLSPGPVTERNFDRLFVELRVEEGKLAAHVTFDLKDKLWREITGTDKRREDVESADVASFIARFQELVKAYSKHK